MKVRTILHPIKTIKQSNAWGDYCYMSQGFNECTLHPEAACIEEECEGCESYLNTKRYKPRLLFFCVRWIGGWIAWQYKRLVCKFRESDGWATPDSGGMGAHCIRCGTSWRSPMY